MKKLTAIAWLGAVFAIFGVFVFTGLMGSIAASLLRIWDTPIAGGAAAFSVVLAAYLFAPVRKVRTSSIAFVIGAFVAWIFIGHSVYPESYAALAYQPTYLPFACSLIGGIFGLAVVLFLHRRSASGQMRDAQQSVSPDSSGATEQ